MYLLKYTHILLRYLKAYVYHRQCVLYYITAVASWLNYQKLESWPQDQY